VALALTVLAMMAFDPPDTANYEPVYEGCNTYDCDQRVAAKRERRKVQRLHKAAVRWAKKHSDVRRRVVRPFRAWLASTRRCESGGNYSTNTGNGFYGAYQFTMSSWHAVGGRGMPHLNEKLEQDYRAVLLRRVQGTGAWPVCG